MPTSFKTHPLEFKKEDLKSFVPELPPIIGKVWHCTIRSGRLLPDGYRPLMKDEKICRGDLREVSQPDMAANDPCLWEEYEGTFRGAYRDDIHVDNSYPLHITQRKAEAAQFKQFWPVLPKIDISATPPEQGLPPFISADSPRPGKKLIRQILTALPAAAWEHRNTWIAKAYNTSASTVGRYRHKLGIEEGKLNIPLTAPKGSDTPPVPPAPTAEDFARVESIEIPAPAPVHVMAGIQEEPDESELPGEIEADTTGVGKFNVRSRRHYVVDRLLELGGGMLAALEQDDLAAHEIFFREYEEHVGTLRNLVDTQQVMDTLKQELPGV